jgi:hypothetical protein
MVQEGSGGLSLGTAGEACGVKEEVLLRGESRLRGRN